MAMATLPRQAAPVPAANGRSGAAPPSSSDARNATAPDSARLFQRGQDALTQGRLDEAERDFRQLLQLDPQAGGAYANLGVVYMRRKQWNKALPALQKAEHLMP